MYVGLWACRSTNWWVQQIDVLGWQLDAQCGGLVRFGVGFKAGLGQV